MATHTVTAVRTTSSPLKEKVEPKPVLEVGVLKSRELPKLQRLDETDEGPLARLAALEKKLGPSVSLSPPKKTRVVPSLFTRMSYAFD